MISENVADVMLMNSKAVLTERAVCRTRPYPQPTAIPVRMVYVKKKRITLYSMV